MVSSCGFIAYPLSYEPDVQAQLMIMTMWSSGRCLPVLQALPLYVAQNKGFFPKKKLMLKLYRLIRRLKKKLLVWRGFVHPVTLVSMAGIYQAYRVDVMIRGSRDWRDLHGRGSRVRILYLAVGIVLILTVAFFG
ncbi:MAG: hypothetical protein NTW27_00985 [Deltaproteobacteria bacterium]|nr:hypothetical protein [Deltaproteobacteria bacterium]